MFILLLVSLCMVQIISSKTFYSSPSILVVGSANADVIIPTDQFPAPGETILITDKANAGVTIAGGKGANQAVACQRLDVSTRFVCQFGSDANALMLKSVLQENNVDIESCINVDKPSGMGLVFLQSSGAVSSIVVGGSNAAWSENFDAANLLQTADGGKPACVMLQMEIPQHVNEAIATTASALGIPIFQDIGGEERPISDSHLRNCLYISPNLSELRRMTLMPVDTEQNIIDAAKLLQSRGARNVLVTIGSDGALLLTENGDMVRQCCCPVDTVVDETAAGDNFRAAFVTAHFVDQKSLKDSLAFAAAAGAVAVSKLGAIPALATRQECTVALQRLNSLHLRGGARGEREADDSFPFKFASRLNSMKDRADLWDGDLTDLTQLIARQGAVTGLDLVDFNYPQHLTQPVNDEELNTVKESLKSAGLACGAICLRFPKDMQLGAFTHPSAAMRATAIQLTKEACAWAIALGTNEVVVWSAFDGYDYSFQVDYSTLISDVADAFRQVCDAFPDVKLSLEYKPTDEHTRFFAVPSTGAAVLLVNEVNRENFGLTLDFGHCLMAGENPAQSVACVARKQHYFADRIRDSDNRLFGIQLGDGYGRLGAEDGLAFGSMHPTAALELVYWLLRTNFEGHVYFDTFPRNEDPVRECELNIRRFKRCFAVARQLRRKKYDATFESLLRRHDALGMMQLLEKVEEHT